MASQVRGEELVERDALGEALGAAAGDGVAQTCASNGGSTAAASRCQAMDGSVGASSVKNP
jgi:hypothetical protein